MSTQPKSEPPVELSPAAPTEPQLDSPLGPMLWVLIPFVLILTFGICFPT